MTCSEPHSPSVWRGLHPYRRPGFFLLSEQSKAYYFPFYLSVLTSPAKAVLLWPQFWLKLAMLRQNHSPPTVTRRARAPRLNRLHP